MKLFFDQDFGRAIPRALRQFQQLEVDFVGSGVASNILSGTKDVIWIPIVARTGWLILSQNKRMLVVEEELRLLRSEGAGIVFIDDGTARGFDTFRLLLRKWAWLEEVDTTYPRPFAFTILRSGRTKHHY